MLGKANMKTIKAMVLMGLVIGSTYVPKVQAHDDAEVVVAFGALAGSVLSLVLDGVSNSFYFVGLKLRKRLFVSKIETLEQLKNNQNDQQLRQQCYSDLQALEGSWLKKPRYTINDDFVPALEVHFSNEIKRIDDTMQSIKSVKTYLKTSAFGAIAGAGLAVLYVSNNKK